MSFRARLLVAFVPAVLLPMIALAIVVRDEMETRVSAQFEDRVSAVVSAVDEDLALEGESVETSLVALRKAMVADNRFRLGAVDGVPDERRYVLDYAGRTMQLAGLSMLQIQDEDGRILSSGHFRNEYDRLDPDLPRILASAPGKRALVLSRTPTGSFLALAGMESFRMGGRRFSIVGGTKVDDRFLARLVREKDMVISLVYPGGSLTTDGSQERGKEMRGRGTDEIVRDLTVPFIGPVRGELMTAQVIVSQPLTQLMVLLKSIDDWLMVVALITSAAGFILAIWLASRISRPLMELAEKTSKIDLDRLDIDFRTPRRDEIGALSRLLGAMTERLKVSSDRIKEAERHATLGELARQVNHDVKNGLIPIRNVFRHLAELAEREPSSLPQVFLERQKTLDSSIAYLENLASNYSRLYPRDEHRACNVNAIVRSVLEELKDTDRADLRMELCHPEAVVTGDPVAVRRIIENLVSNAVDSLESRHGTVSVSTELLAKENGVRPRVRISVADTGRGMNEEQRRRAFDEFYTTKDSGTGLGLSIVRKLIDDLGGTVRLESEPGTGTRFVIDLPGGLSGNPSADSLWGAKGGAR